MYILVFSFLFFPSFLYRNNLALFFLSFFTFLPSVMFFFSPSCSNVSFVVEVALRLELHREVIIICMSLSSVQQTRLPSPERRVLGGVAVQGDHC